MNALLAIDIISFTILWQLGLKSNLQVISELYFSGKPSYKEKAMNPRKYALRITARNLFIPTKTEWLKDIATILVFVSFTGCSTTTQDARNGVNDKAGIAVDKLVLVDCVLPGKVRKLGALNTFVTPRQPARLHASECSIRGGEYTAYDRTNLTSSINVWTPLAQQGDATAQNYLGEIYELGVSGNPDYQLAALWFQRAAEQGLKAAQVNLGFLYESGKGVAQDKAKALNLYRLAADLQDDQLEYMSIIDKKVSEQLDRWKDKLSHSQRQTDKQKKEVGKLQRQLELTNSELEKLSRAALLANNKAQNGGPETSAQLAKLRDEKQELLRKLAVQNGEIVSLRQAARQERARMTYQINGLNENQLQLAKQIAKKKNELSRVKDLLTTATEQYQQDKNQYQEHFGNEEKIKNANEFAYQKQIADQTIELIELKQKITFYKQQENIYNDNIAHQKIELVNNENQSSEFKLLSQAKIDSLVLELKQTQSLVANNERRHQELLTENDILIDELKSQDAQAQLGKNTIEQLTNRLTKKAETLVFRHNKIIRLEEKVNQLSAKISGLVKLPKPVLASAENRQASSAKTIASDSAPSGSLSTRFGEFHALIIGNDEYQYQQNLRTAVVDATSIEKVLSTQYGYKTTLLLNATRNDILSTLYTMQGELDNSKNLLVYYAGHGVMRNSRGHWLPVDAQINDQTNWIPTQQVTDLISQFEARKIIIIADSCFSGVLTRSSILSPGIRIDTNNKKHIRWLQAMSKGKSRTVLTSGGLQPVLDGGGGEHSVFAKHFLSALDNNKSVIDAHTLYNRIFPAVKEDAITLNVEQSPQYAPIKGVNHHSVDYFFISQGG